MSKSKQTQTPITNQPPKKSVLTKLKDCFKAKVSKESYDSLLKRYEDKKALLDKTIEQSVAIELERDNLQKENQVLKDTLKEIEDLIDAETEKSDE